MIEHRRGVVDEDIQRSIPIFDRRSHLANRSLRAQVGSDTLDVGGRYAGADARGSSVDPFGIRSVNDNLPARTRQRLGRRKPDA